MKRVILAAVTLISVAFVGTANAQTSANVTVNINLHKVQSISVSAASVNLDYQSENDYLNGVTTEMADHLIVFSTGGFVVKVKSGDDFKKGSESILANTVQVLASNGTKTPTGTVTYAPNLMLSTTATPLITTTKGGSGLKFNVDYIGGKGDAYIVDRFKDSDGNPNVYSATVTYEIVAN